MKKSLLNVISFTIIFSIAASCGTSSQIYSYGNKNKTYTGQLGDSIFLSLKKYLTINANSKLKDTIIIKYDYNNETCWNNLDQSEDENIRGFIKKYKEKILLVLFTRQNVSIFNFREAGNSLNKIKKWDTSIIIDSSKQLFNLIFKERCTCGNSIIIMPNRKFVFVRSDSHFEVLDFSQKRIEEILSNQ